MGYGIHKRFNNEIRCPNFVLNMLVNECGLITLVEIIEHPFVYEIKTSRLGNIGTWNSKKGIAHYLSNEMRNICVYRLVRHIS